MSELVGTRRQFLERFYDPALELPAVSGREELERREVERIGRALAVILIVGSMPRRLGAEATDDELALDRKRARRAGHALGQAMRGWSKKKEALPLDDKIRKAGAQLNWERWETEHVAEIQSELRCLATWAVKNTEQKWGRSVVVRLENEINWISYALRD